MNEFMTMQIIPFYAHPHVHVVIDDHSWYDETVASREIPALPYGTCVVTGADQGIDNVFVNLSDLRTKRALFGPGDFAKYGQSSLQADQLFNGQTTVWFMRVLPDDATYGNIIIAAEYRLGYERDNDGLPTPLRRLEIRFRIHRVAEAKTDDDIDLYAERLIHEVPLTVTENLPEIPSLPDVLVMTQDLGGGPDPTPILELASVDGGNGNFGVANAHSGLPEPREFTLTNTATFALANTTVHIPAGFQILNTIENPDRTLPTYLEYSNGNPMLDGAGNPIPFPHTIGTPEFETWASTTAQGRAWLAANPAYIDVPWTTENPMVIAMMAIGQTVQFHLSPIADVGTSYGPLTVTSGAAGSSEIRLWTQFVVRTLPVMGDVLLNREWNVRPLTYIRSIGRGQYGNRYSVRITRDNEAEREYRMTMYRYTLISTDRVSRVVNNFAGSMYQTTRQGMSTLIDDVMDQFPTGSAPIFIYTYEDHFNELFDVYRDYIVANNAEVLRGYSRRTHLAQINALEMAQRIIDDSNGESAARSRFDPLFGLIPTSLRPRGMRENEAGIPYYRNYTMRSDIAYEAPALVVPNGLDGEYAINDLPIATHRRPLGSTTGLEPIPGLENLRVGSVVEILSDPHGGAGAIAPPSGQTQIPISTPGGRTSENANLAMNPDNIGRRMQYRIGSIDETNDADGDDFNPGFIRYSTSWRVVPVDAEEFTGDILQRNAGNRFTGGHDGEFQEILDQTTGTLYPTAKEQMPALLSREYVKAFLGQKDRKILSPARVNLDFIFDANYNMDCITEIPRVVGSSDVYAGDPPAIDPIYGDIPGTTLQYWDREHVYEDVDFNVKKAMYNLNEFRNRNGMSINPAEGAGCLLHLDCNFTGLSDWTGPGKDRPVTQELIDIITMFDGGEYDDGFDGRSTSIDLGYYEIFDPISRKRIMVTACYFIASNLVNHILREGLNRPFVRNWAQLRSLRRNPMTGVVTGNFIRDTFRPDIDLIDWEVKEALFMSRINYYESFDEGRLVHRACQNTRQRDASALLEENNIRVLNTLKKQLEKACKNYLYEWNEPEIRRGFTEAQMEIYRPWQGQMVQSLDIIFTANEWEQERMIMRCHVEVIFRGIIKRIILHINILPSGMGMADADLDAARVGG